MVCADYWKLKLIFNEPLTAQIISIFMKIISQRLCLIKSKWMALRLTSEKLEKIRFSQYRRKYCVFF